VLGTGFATPLTKRGYKKALSSGPRRVLSLTADLEALSYLQPLQLARD